MLYSRSLLVIYFNYSSMYMQLDFMASETNGVGLGWRMLANISDIQILSWRKLLRVRSSFFFFFFFNRAEGTLQHLGNGLPCPLCISPTAVRKSSSETQDSLTPGTEVFSFHGEVSSLDPACDYQKVEDNLIRPHLPPSH